LKSNSAALWSGLAARIAALPAADYAASDADSDVDSDGYADADADPDADPDGASCAKQPDPPLGGPSTCFPRDGFALEPIAARKGA